MVMKKLIDEELPTAYVATEEAGNLMEGNRLEEEKLPSLQEIAQ